MIQNDRRRTNSAVDQKLVVNESITTPSLKTLDLTALRSFTLGPDVVFTGASSVVTNSVTTTDIKTTDIQTTTLEATTVDAMAVNVTGDIQSHLVAAQTLRLLANSNQILVGSPNITTINIDCSANRTIGLPSTSGLNADIVLTEGTQTINGVKTFTDMVVFLSSFSIASLALTAVSNQLTMGTGQTITVNAPTPAASRTYTMPDVLANANFIMSEGAQTLNGVKTFSATAVFLAGFSLASLTLTAVSNQLTLGSVSTITVNAPTPAASRTYTMPDVLANANFIMSEGAQTLNGVKTFSATAVFLAGFSLASLTLSAVSNQLTLGAGNTITLTAPTPAASRTYTIPDVLANASFVMTEGSQSINGTKMFFNNITFDSNLILDNTSVIQFSKPTNQMTFTTGGNTVTLNVAASAASRTYTIDDIGANASFVMNTGTQSINGFKTFILPATFNSGIIIDLATNQIIFGSANTITLNAPAPAAPRTYTMPDVLANANFIMSEGTQTINGLKTFSNSVTLNGGVPSLAVTNASNQIALGTGNTVTITAPAPAASRVYTIPDANTNANFIMSESALGQTINGTVTIGDSQLRVITLEIFPSGVFSDPHYVIQGPNPGATRIYSLPDTGGAAQFVMTAGLNSSVSFTTSGGTATPLTYYEELKTTVTFSLAIWQFDNVTDVRFSRIGNIVTMHMTAFSTFTFNTPASSNITSTAGIPSRFRPVVDTVFWITVINSSADCAGECTVNTSGIITIRVGLTSGGLTNPVSMSSPPNGTYGFRGVSHSWLVS